MGQGLGKNSPVQLTLGRENYEALIDRHGQWVRWRTSTKCACVNPGTFQPDIHCTRCGGRGVIYGFQNIITTQTVVMAKNTSGVLIIDNEFEHDELVKVYDRDGIEYEAEKEGCMIFLSGETIRSHYYNVLMTRQVAQNLKITNLKKNGDYWEVLGLESSKTKIDGVYYTAPGDLISIGKIKDSISIEFEIESYRLNKINLKKKTEIIIDEETGEESEIEIVPTEPITAEDVSFIPPFTFALLNQNLSKGDLAAMVDAQGDAVCTFPYFCDVSESDIITVLAGTITQKEIISHTGGKTDPLPVYFVAEIVSVEDKDGYKFKQGKDYILCGTNEVKWLEHCLDVGEAFSIVFKVYPTYSVTKDIPQLRSSENQRFPKKAVVKYMTSYSEKRKGNINGISK